MKLSKNFSLKELTKSTVEKNQQRSTAILEILKEHFTKGTVLSAEMNLYSALLETRNVQRTVAERMLHEIKASRNDLNEENLFDAHFGYLLFEK